MKLYHIFLKAFVVTALILSPKYSSAKDVKVLDYENHRFSLSADGNVRISNYRYKYEQGFTKEDKVRNKYYEGGLTLSHLVKKYNLIYGINAGYGYLDNKLWEGHYFNKAKGLNRLNLFVEHPKYGYLIAGRFTLLEGEFPIVVTKGLFYEKELLDMGSFGKIYSGVGVGDARLDFDDSDTDFKTTFASLRYQTPNKMFVSQIKGFVGKLDEVKMKKWKTIDLPEYDEVVYISGDPRVAGIELLSSLSYKGFTLRFNAYGYKLENVPYVFMQGSYAHNPMATSTIYLDYERYYSKDVTFVYEASLSYKLYDFIEPGIAYKYENFNSVILGTTMEYDFTYKTFGVFVKIYPFTYYGNDSLKDSFVKLEVGKGKHINKVEYFDALHDRFEYDYKSIFLTYNLKY